MRNNWTRDELILAFNLYCKLPYGQFNNRNSEVKKLAEILGRSSGAIAYKLVNFVSLDPKQKLLGRKGATNIGKLDKEVFVEFTQNFDELFVESEKLLEQKTNDIIEIPIDVEIKIDETKKEKIKFV
jgi:putative restriction endonuclease